MEESTKELIGITPASILSMVGLSITLIIFIFIIRHSINIYVANLFFVLGIAISSLAIYINLQKKDKVKWRKANIIIHILMLILSLVIIILSNIFYFMLKNISFSP